MICILCFVLLRLHLITIIIDQSLHQLSYNQRLQIFPFDFLLSHKSPSPDHRIDAFYDPITSGRQLISEINSKRIAFKWKAKLYTKLVLLFVLLLLLCRSCCFDFQCIIPLYCHIHTALPLVLVDDEFVAHLPLL